MTSTSDAGARRPKARATFSSRSVFVFAAIGSAVGLGNIWRFPFVAYEGGGGAFLLPYLIALLTAGIPLLFFDYAIGHKFRGSSPLSFRRIHKTAEPIGWFQVGVSIVIAIYYAAIIAWSAAYAWFSVTEAWGSGLAETEDFLFNNFLQLSDNEVGITSFVPVIALLVAAVWIVSLIALSTGVQKGIGLLNMVFIPILVVLFAAMVIRSLFLDGAMDGLNQFFTPDWGALLDGSVWIAAYGQIFFSLSVAFGIMITYSSYLKRKSNLTGSGLVVGFSNSSFEVLAGIGVFAALGFLVSAADAGWDDVSGGVGLAFVAFPALVSEMPASQLWGAVFFICIFLAGITSFISIVEVVISSIQDKLAIKRTTAVLVVGVPMGIVSVALMGATTGMYTLDTLDKFVNSFGIIGIAIVAIVAITAIYRKLGELRDHLNSVSSWNIGPLWMLFIGVITPIVLIVSFVLEFRGVIVDGYEGYDSLTLGIWGWGMLGALVVFALVMTLFPWKKGIHVDGPPEVDTDPSDAVHLNSQPVTEKEN